ncbi:hypothetical protein L484_005127 [Morus notabilis]|uniref:Uncharacterized protein n=1 Tax=Morus notabilis TaxID=981085 RepID=W9RLH0_9ROSA|nr:hypothetical protein L484_005127 [Morus notabilis]
MKHFMQPRNAILRETKMESPASPNPSHSPAISAAKLKSPLPPQPLSLNPLKRKPRMETVPENSIMRTCESGVQI